MTAQDLSESISQKEAEFRAVTLRFSTMQCPMEAQQTLLMADSDPEFEA